MQLASAKGPLLPLLVLGMLMSCATAGTAQIARGGARIVGCVLDEVGTLPGIDITLAGDSFRRAVTTGSDGCYELAGVPPGHYLLSAASVVFVSGERHVVVRPDSAILDQDFEMRLKPGVVREPPLEILPAPLPPASPASGTQQAAATGTIAGVVRDQEGAPLPGVVVTVSVGRVEAKATTDLNGQFTIGSVPPGAGIVRAVLPGFCPSEKRLALSPTESAAADFRLRPGPLSMIDWAAPPSRLADLFAESDVVAHVRIVAIKGKADECEQRARLTAAVLELLKPSRPVAAGTLAFWQEQWASEPTPYPVGTEMVVFLREWQGTLIRSYGPHAVFLVSNGEVMSSRFPAHSAYVGMPVKALLAELRAFRQ